MVQVLSSENFNDVFQRSVGINFNEMMSRIREIERYVKLDLEVDQKGGHREVDFNSRFLRIENSIAGLSATCTVMYDQLKQLSAQLSQIQRALDSIKK